MLKKISIDQPKTTNNENIIENKHHKCLCWCSQNCGVYYTSLFCDCIGVSWTAYL